MKSLSVIELSKLYGINRQTIYNHINKGILSKNSDNKIDLSEAIRVFGEPSKKQSVKEPVKVDSQNSTENLLLRQQIDILKNQLDDAKHRESFYQNQIETMQRLLGVVSGTGIYSTLRIFTPTSFNDIQHGIFA